MVTTRRMMTFAMTGLCLGLLLTGCGRKAALDTPTAAAQPSTAEVQAETQGVYTPEQPAPTAISGGFILDPLIGN